VERAAGVLPEDEIQTAVSGAEKAKAGFSRLLLFRFSSLRIRCAIH